MLSLLTLSPVAGAQTPEVPPSVSSPVTPPTPPTEASLHVTPAERRYFELGLVQARAAFAYAALAKQAARIARTQPTEAQVGQLAKLAPTAVRNRAGAEESLARALALLADMSAPDAVLLPVTRLHATLAKPPVLTGDAQNVAALNRDAGTVLAALQESSRLTGTLQNAALKKWLTGGDGAGQVWYAEGLISGVGEIASRDSLPDLLPPTPELATDLRGLRDWLSGRLPDPPTAEQTALQAAITHFLQQSASSKKPKPLTLTQLRTLGDISRRLQAQVLGQPSLATPAYGTTPAP